MNALVVPGAFGRRCLIRLSATEIRFSLMAKAVNVDIMRLACCLSRDASRTRVTYLAQNVSRHAKPSLAANWIPSM
jgi:hypothetical protein